MRDNDRSHRTETAIEELIVKFGDVVEALSEGTNSFWSVGVASNNACATDVVRIPSKDVRSCSGT